MQHGQFASHLQRTSAQTVTSPASPSDGNFGVVNGDATAVITLGNGNTINIGAGSGAVGMNGAGNAVTTGSGTHLVVDCDAASIVWKDTVTLGAGSNWVFLGGGGNTVNDGSGTDVIVGSHGGNDTFVANATGGTDRIYNFTTANGDRLDLSGLLAGTDAAVGGSNLGSHVALASVADAHNAAWTETVLTVTGVAATATITLVNTGGLSLSDLIAAKSIVA